MMTKSSLRAALKTKRDSMSERAVKQASAQILNKLSNEFDWQSIQSLNTYLSVQAWHEIDTWPLLQYIWREWPHIQASTVRMHNDGTMDAVLIDQNTDWVLHEWGVAEPREGEIVPITHQFDVIIVPVLGFDDQNNRLGLGKGYYDRFLANQPGAQKIGLGYSWSFVEALPYEPHDIKLDQIITDI